jgi:hypothetical protein
MPLPSGNPPSAQDAWESLEDRIQRLLELLVKLRSVNAQLMKENQKLKLQSGQKPSLPIESAEDEDWRHRYEEAAEDIGQLRRNLEQMKRLVEKLESGAPPS